MTGIAHQYQDLAAGSPGRSGSGGRGTGQDLPYLDDMTLEVTGQELLDARSDRDVTARRMSPSAFEVGGGQTADEGDRGGQDGLDLVEQLARRAPPTDGDPVNPGGIRRD